MTEDRVISTVDSQARHAHKTVARRQDGFKAHVVVEPDTGLITGTTLTKASGADSADAAVAIGLLGLTGEEFAGETERSDAPLEGLKVLADSAYGTGAMLAALQQAGHMAIIKPWPLRHPIPGGFTTADFTVDETTRTITCPAGHTVTFTPVKRAARFEQHCTDCPLRSRCTTATRGRMVTLHPHDALQRAHRARAADPDFQADYRQHRPMVERSIAWLTRGNRRLRYRGVAKNNSWLHLRVAAINLRRLLTLGLTPTPTSWAIPATA